MVGIDVSEKSIKVVEVSDGNMPVLETVCWSTIKAGVIKKGVVQDVGEMTRALQGAMQKCTPIPVAGRQVVVSVPESQSFVRVLDLPKMSDDETDEAVQWAVRHHIPFDLDRVYIDWQMADMGLSADGRRKVLVGAAQRNVVDPLLEVLDSLKLEVEALELEAQAIIRSLLPFNAQDVQGVLIVDLGATSTNVIYFDRGTMRFTTSIKRGGEDLTQQLVGALNIQPSMAAEKKALVGTSGDGDQAQVATILRAATLEIVQQIEQVVREVAVTGSAGNGVRAIILSGGSANLPGITSIFNEVFEGVPIQLGNPLINVSTGEKGSTLSVSDAIHFSTALGLALRSAVIAGG
jgi:type IV pilus assembly protein PilM